MDKDECWQMVHKKDESILASVCTHVQSALEKLEMRMSLYQHLCTSTESVAMQACLPMAK